MRSTEAGCAALAFKEWLSRGLRDQYGAIAAAPVPEELLQLVRTYDPAPVDQHCNPVPAMEARDLAALRGLTVGTILSGMLWAVLARAFR